ncbi:MAG: branched-chain amino acid ABC transporter permease [Xanthobacteraceae bacterium]|nr:branched-chain amino acid ABC transporter permease [Xanthobacteraceae bacterium]
MSTADTFRQADAALKKKRAWHWLEYVFWLAVAATVFLFPSQHTLLTQIAIWSLFALSLDLLLGYAGIVSLGHAAYFGFGAYVAALFAINFTGEPLTVLLVAGIAAGLLGLVTSLLVLRGSDLTRLMVTLGIALVMYELANQMSWLTGGADGLTGMPVNPVFGVFPISFRPTNSYIYVLCVLFVLFVVARRIVHSPFGYSLRAIKGNPLRASSIGISTNRRLIAVYALGAAYAGVAGALLAQTTPVVSLTYIDFQRSADVLLMLIIGGTGYLYGGIVGSALFLIAQKFIGNVTPQYWEFWIGFALVVIALFARDRGVFSIIERVANALRKEKAKP